MCPDAISFSPGNVDEDLVDASLVFHRFVKTEAATGGGHDPAETLFVVQQDATDVRLRVVELHS